MRATFSFCASLLIAISTARCGSGSMPPASTGTGAGGSSDAGDGGQPDAGTVGGGGQPDAGGGGGQPDAGGSVNPDECAGLGPDAVGQPTASAALLAGRYDTCSLGSTDGSGTVALMVANDFQGPPLRSTVHLFRPSGAENGTYAGFDTVLVEELAGFELSNWDLRQGELAAIDVNGSVTATSGKIDLHPWLVANDPLGGMVVVFKQPDSTPPNVVAAYDELLNPRFRTQLSSTEEPVALGVDRKGNTLVLFDAADRYGAGKVGGIWIDHSGNAGTEFQALEGIASPHSLLLAPRVDKGLFVRGDSGQEPPWIRQFDPMSSGDAPPDWLAARPGTTLHMARNGRAYAVIHPARADATCHADIEVVATSGKNCGTAVFPADPVGGSCAGNLVVGYDGTVVEMGAPVFTGSGSNRNCTFHWWTGFLH